MRQKTYRIKAKDLLKSKPAKSVSTKALNKRVTAAMKNINREFQKKQRTSLEKASEIILNA